ncbi:uncharacterized protein LOC133892284 [Phragmites australis]|uniref:uncharacterized protein LOC133892284 n=1 Tax=Phragmites australis TaxID=29695 RepID=UPI002D78FE12|nr:uncharacterized protein LOC133892284 [Phragmites australis]
MLLDTMLDQFLSVIVGIEQFDDLDKMPFEETVGRLKAFEECAHSLSVRRDRRRMAVTPHQATRVNTTLLQIATAVEMVMEAVEAMEKVDVVMGHYVNECKAQKKKEEEKVSEEMIPGLQQRRHAMLLNEEKLKAELRDTIEVGSSSEVWYLDNGTSNYMTGDKEKFREVYYINRLCRYIINLGQLTEVGHKVILDAEHLRVYDSSPTRLLMKVRKTPNCVYKIELHQAMLVCFLANLEDPAWLWHARLGHVNLNAIKLLVDKEMAIGVSLITHSN